MGYRTIFLAWAILAATLAVLPSCGEGIVGNVDEVSPDEASPEIAGTETTGFPGLTSVVQTEKVHLGNFGYMGAAAQWNKSIEYDACGYKGALDQKRPGVFTVVQHYSYPGFSWKKDYILRRFKLAEELADKGADGLVFLLQEEIYRPSATFQVDPETAKGDGYTIVTARGTYGDIPAVRNIKEDEGAYFLALLKAWKRLSKSLKKTAVVVGCSAECEADDVWDYLYTKPGVEYIARKFGMIYLYHYPATKELATGAACTNAYTKKKGTHNAASYINFWRKKGFQGLINYLLVTKFSNNVGTTKESVVEKDFQNAVEAGADIISCYPYVSGKDNDTLAVERMLRIFKRYYKE